VRTTKLSAPDSTLDNLYITAVAEGLVLRLLTATNTWLWSGSFCFF